MNKFLITMILTFLVNIVSAHGGGLNAQGCHNERKTGGYHCHRSPSAPRASTPSIVSPIYSSDKTCKVTIGNEYYEFKPSETSNANIKFKDSDGSLNIKCY